MPFVGDAPDDSKIADGEILYRRVLDREDMVVHDENLQRWTPRNAALRFDPDGMSVYLAGVLAERGIGPAQVAALRTGSIVFSVTAAEARQEGLGVTHTPAGPPSDPVAFAHGSICRDPQWSDRELRERRNRLRRRFTLAWGTVS
ncbi:MAG: hypothetical protein OXT07_11325 [bacterium]|nr:hypothetical protein [bacterium]